MIFIYSFLQPLVVVGRWIDPNKNTNKNNSNNGITWFFFIVSYTLFLLFAVKMIQTKMQIKTIVSIE